MAHALLESQGELSRRSPRSDAPSRAASVTPPSAESPVGGRRPVQCGGCAASFKLRDWFALPLAAVLTGDAIAGHVSKWPAGVRIEIRQCPRCRRSIARTSV